MALAMVSCAHLGFGRGRESLDQRLVLIDGLIHERDDPDKLDEALVAIDALALELGDDPRLLSRLAHVHYARAYGHPDPARPPVRVYEAGREAAWRCLYQDPAFEGVLSSTGGRINGAAAGRIEEERASCLLWLVANWSRWLALRDPGGLAIDLEPLQVLSDRAVELSAGRRRAQALGSAGLSRALAPAALGPDLDESRRLFGRAIQQDPDNLSLRVDLAEYVFAPLEDELRFEQTLRGVLEAVPAEGLWVLENRRARERAEALLSAHDAAGVATPDLP